MAKNQKKVPPPRKTQRGKAKKRSFWSFIQNLAIWIFVFSIAGGAGLLLAYNNYAEDLPSLAKIDERPPIITNIYDRKGRLIGEYFIERRIPVKREAIPDKLWNAFIAIEDQRYLQHNGVDYHGIGRAFYHNLLEGKIVEGASTITMQVARSIFLTRDKTYARKIKETILAYRIERDFTKDQILTLYMNQIYLGHGTYGIGAAAMEYFGKTLDKLTLGEIAVLAAIPKEPAKYDPYRHPDESLKRRNLVLDRMLEQGRITAEEAQKAKQEKIHLVPRSNPARTATPYFTEYVRRYLVDQYGEEMVYQQGLKVFTTVDMDWDREAQQALRWGIRRLDRQQGWRGPEKHLEGEELAKYIETTKNSHRRPPAVDDVVEAVVTSVPNGDSTYAVLQTGKFRARLPQKERKFMNKLNEEPYNKIKAGLKPRSYLETGDIVQVKVTGSDADGTLVVELDPEPMLQGALLSMDPYTGEVRAMVGGYDFDTNEFNRAVQARRQPGSSFKPIIYTSAVESGYTPSTVINDAPVVLDGANGAWRPGNYGGKFSGPQTMAFALQRSVNTISIKLMMDMGVSRVIKYAKLMGFDPKDLPHDLSLALGSATISLLELTRAYAVLANEGRLIQPIFVLRVYDRDGRILEDRVPRVEGFDPPPDDPAEFRKWLAGEKEPVWGPEGFAFRRQLCDARGAKVLDAKTAYVMISMMRNVVEHGTGMNARLTGIEVAGKTGTTNDYKDALFVGFTTQLLTGVWIGYDSGRISMGRGSTGGDISAPVWQRYMKKALEGQHIPDFPRPDGVIIYTFDLLTGTFPGPDSQYVGRAAFIEGTQPLPYIPPPTIGQEFLQQDLKFQGGEETPPP